MNPRRHRFSRAVFLGLAAGLLISAAASAHEGHDHGDKPKPAAATTLLASGAAFAHGGEDHSHGNDDKASAAMTTTATGEMESPRRLPDGSLYVPKRSQRLLGVRTIVSQSGEAAESVPLIGHVIPDPNFSGRVQASQSGRIEPGDQEGLPYLGQRVEAGQVLAYVVPAVNTVERSGVQQQIAQIDKEFAIVQSRVERLSGLAGSVPQKNIDEARATLNGLRKQRQALIPTLNSREPLRAPISSVIAASNAAVGQFVETREQILFEVLDPAHLLVEATAFDHGVVERMRGATAIIGDRGDRGGGDTHPLTFVGHGATLRQQAMPPLFRIERVAQHGHALHVGQPARVLLHTTTRQTGIVLPRQSVVRGANGQSQVWEHASAQRFVARPVRMQPLDGDTVLVSAGPSCCAACRSTSSPT